MSAHVDPKPVIWYCRSHGALPVGTRTCVECAEASDTYRADLPGQLTIEDVA